MVVVTEAKPSKPTAVTIVALVATEAETIVTAATATTAAESDKATTTSTTMKPARETVSYGLAKKSKDKYPETADTYDNEHAISGDGDNYDNQLAG